VEVDENEMEVKRRRIEFLLPASSSSYETISREGCEGEGRREGKEEEEVVEG